jgi:hypothetical protein
MWHFCLKYHAKCVTILIDLARFLSPEAKKNPHMLIISAGVRPGKEFSLHAATLCARPDNNKSFGKWVHFVQHLWDSWLCR